MYIEKEQRVSGLYNTLYSVYLCINLYFVGPTYNCCDLPSCSLLWIK